VSNVVGSDVLNTGVAGGVDVGKSPTNSMITRSTLPHSPSVDLAVSRNLLATALNA
jgi:hypothetical protein